MARKYSDELNRRLYRTVKSYNQVISRAEARGVKGLPRKRSIREMRSQFVSANDMKKELSRLETMLNNREALRRHQTKDGTISNWQYNYILNKKEEVNQWLEREIGKAEERLEDYPSHLYGIRADIHKLQKDQALLNSDFSKLTAQDFKTVSSIVERFNRKDVKTRTGREYFMENLDYLFTAKGMDEKDRKKMYRKLDALSNEQFLELYKRHDIISDIMLMLPSPTEAYNTRRKIANTEVQDQEVKKQLEEFENNLDNYITEATEAII